MINTKNIHDLFRILDRAATRLLEVDSPSIDWANCATGVARTGDRLIRTAKSLGVPLPTDNAENG